VTSMSIPLGSARGTAMSTIDRCTTAPAQKDAAEEIGVNHLDARYSQVFEGWVVEQGNTSNRSISNREGLSTRSHKSKG
jgi:hypothetical protein